MTIAHILTKFITKDGNVKKYKGLQLRKEIAGFNKFRFKLSTNVSYFERDEILSYIQLFDKK